MLKINTAQLSPVNTAAEECLIFLRKEGRELDQLTDDNENITAAEYDRAWDRKVLIENAIKELEKLIEKPK